MELIKIIPGMTILVSERIRHVTHADKKLEESFKENGIQSPIILTESSDGNYFLLDGLKRLNYFKATKCDLYAVVVELKNSLNSKLIDAMFNNLEGFTTAHKLEVASIIAGLSMSFDASVIDTAVGFTPGGYLMARHVMDVDLYSMVTNEAAVTGKDLDKLDEYRTDMLYDDISIKKAHQLVNKLISALEKRDKKLNETADDERPDLSLGGFDSSSYDVKKIIELPVPADKRFIQLEKSNYTCAGCGLHGRIYKDILHIVREIPDYLGGDDDTLETLCPTCDTLMEVLSVNFVEVPKEVGNSLSKVVELSDIRKTLMEKSDIPYEQFEIRVRRKLDNV